MEPSISSVLLIIFLLIIVLGMVIYVYLCRSKTYTLFESVLAFIVTIPAGIYHILWVIKEYFVDKTDRFRTKKFLITGKMIKIYSKSHSISLPTFAGNFGENFTDTMNIPVSSFDERIMDFQKENGEVIVLNLDESIIKEKDFGLDERITVRCKKYFYDDDMHLIAIV